MFGGTHGTASTCRKQSQPSPVWEPQGTPGKGSQEGQGLQGPQINEEKVGDDVPAAAEALGAGAAPTWLTWRGLGTLPPHPCAEPDPAHMHPGVPEDLFWMGTARGSRKAAAPPPQEQLL